MELMRPKQLKEIGVTPEQMLKYAKDLTAFVNKEVKEEKPSPSVEDKPSKKEKK